MIVFLCLFFSVDHVKEIYICVIIFIQISEDFRPKIGSQSVV